MAAVLPDLAQAGGINDPWGELARHCRPNGSGGCLPPQADFRFPGSPKWSAGLAGIICLCPIAAAWRDDGSGALPCLDSSSHPAGADGKQVAISIMAHAAYASLDDKRYPTGRDPKG